MIKKRKNFYRETISFLYIGTNKTITEANLDHKLAKENQLFDMIVRKACKIQ